MDSSKTGSVSSIELVDTNLPKDSHEDTDDIFSHNADEASDRWGWAGYFFGVDPDLES